MTITKIVIASLFRGVAISAIKNYYDKSSPLYRNKRLIKEYYNPNLPIDKKPQNWNADDLFNAMESPLYKHDKQLQNMTKEYIKHRSKRRYCGLK